MNFKKLRPRVTVLKQSKVIEELQNIATAEPPLIEQLRRTSVFLQKPQRPVPTPRKKQEEGTEAKETESYKVVIKKQKRRSVTDRLLERGLLKPEGASTPDPFTPEVNMESKGEIGKGTEKIEEEDSCSILDLDDLERCSMLEGVAVSIFLDHHHSSLFETSKTNDLETGGVATSPRWSKKGEEKVVALTSRGRRRAFHAARKARYFPTRFEKLAHVGNLVKVKGRSSFERGSKVVSGDRRSTERIERRVPPGRLSVEKSSKSRIKGRYLETYLKREDNWTRRMVDGMFAGPEPALFSPVESRDKILSSGEISPRGITDREEEKIHVRGTEFALARLRPYIFSKFPNFQQESRVAGSCSKSRYVKRIFRRSSTTFSFKRNVRSGRNSSTIETRRRCYLGAKYLVEKAILFDRFSSRKKLIPRARYVERILKKQFESLGLIANHIRCQLLQRVFSDSSAVIPAFSSLNSRQTESVSPAREGGVLSNLIRSTERYISTEVFHRGSRRSRRLTPGPSSNFFDSFRRFLRIDRSSLERFSKGGETIGNEEKIVVEDNDRDNGRRLSFVPTILCQGFTNRIGVDFARLVAYAFVPCTSIVLLYMYK